ncbi:MAG: hypothetical protein ACLS4Z_01710 [Christensenellaceae bacterium]
MFAEEAISSDKTLLPQITAAAVSSQEDSIPRMSGSFTMSEE